MRSGRLALLAAAAALTSFIGCDSARPIEQRSDASACARCHGFPPPAPHVQDAGACQVCHGTTVGPNNEILADGTHMNGQVDATGHSVPYGTHPVTALGGLGGCRACHGNDFGALIVSGANPGDPLRSCNDCHGDLGFADWQTNCTFCHGTRTTGWTAAQLPLAAPPAAVPLLVDGNVVHPSAATDSGVGAHQAHLTAGPYANAFACSTCHTVPTSAEALTHFTGGGAKATVAFDALAGKGVTSPAYANGTCAVYCHGSGSGWPTGSVAATPAPAWTSTGLTCNACHASRPATGSHGLHPAANAPCAFCHLGYAQDTTVDPAVHVNGSRSVAFNTRGGTVRTLTDPGWTCTTCHTSAADGNANAPVF